MIIIGTYENSSIQYGLIYGLNASYDYNKYPASGYGVSGGSLKWVHSRFNTRNVLARFHYNYT